MNIVNTESYSVLFLLEGICLKYSYIHDSNCIYSFSQVIFIELLLAVQLYSRY